MKVARSAYLALIVIIALGTCPSLTFGYSSGPIDSVAGNPPAYNNCTLCHNSFPLNSGPGAIFFVFPITSYVSGATMPVDISVADPLGMRWGFEMTAADWSWAGAGQFIITDPAHTQLSDNVGPPYDFVKHTSLGSFAGTPFGVAWPILWTAPVSAFQVTFYFAGIGANNDGTPQGDYVYLDTLVLNAASPVIVDIYSTGSTTFPASGGTLDWDISITNWSGAPADTIDLWVDVTLPSGAIYGPILGPVLNFPMPGSPPGQNITRSRQTTIPGNAPAGSYILNAYIGIYLPPNNQIMAEDHFGFNKLGSDDATGALQLTDSGEPIASDQTAAARIDGAALLTNYPNPFNPVTTIAYDLDRAGPARLTVYALDGREVAVLADGQHQAGRHQVIFDATGLSSGLYLYRLETASQRLTGKMFLLK